jgi:glucose-6-phosphate 1-dehydrogenase
MIDCTFIIFGATGDLSKRKLLPALYQLIRKKKIQNYTLICTSLEEKKIEEIFVPVKDLIQDYNEQTWQEFISRSLYYSLDVKKSKDFVRLKELIIAQENKYNVSGNRLVYCAVPSTLYSDITKNVVKNSIIKRGRKEADIWNRMVYEKPFGENLKSAKKINKKMLSLIDEDQIFRVDHYISKEIIENITFIRFTNTIFEPLWNSKYIDSVQIILNEKVGLEGRGSYYDLFGALKDVVQNHMLQLVALVAMEPPKKISSDYIRDSKAKVLKHIIPVDGILGQYSGYREEPGIKQDSKTETFASLQLIINQKRWKNVPFFLKTGKFLDTKSIKIVIKFKPAYCIMSTSCPIEPDYVTISVFPKEGITIEIYTKTPQKHNEIMRATMDFCYDCLFVPGAPQTYESIIMDIIKGEKLVSVREDEIKYSWKVIDTIKEMNLPLYVYKKGSSGPKEAEEFAVKNNFVWK